MTLETIAPLRDDLTLMLPYRSEAVQTVPDALILACQDQGAAAVPGWLSCWLPLMAWQADPPAPPTRLDR